MAGRRIAAAVVCLVLSLGADARSVHAEALAPIQRVAVAGGELVDVVWGPPLLVAHGRRLDLHAGPPMAEPAPIASVATEERIVAVAASEGRALIITSDDGRASTELGLELRDPRRPKVVHRARDGRPPVAAALSGPLLWRAEADGSLALWSWLEGAAPRPPAEPILAADGSTLTRLQAKGRHAVVTREVFGQLTGPPLLFSVASDGRTTDVTELPPGIVTLADRHVVVHSGGVGSRLSVWVAPLDDLAGGRQLIAPGRPVVPAAQQLRGIVVVDDRLWIVLSHELGARVPGVHHVLVWSLLEDRQVADVSVAVPACDRVLAVREGEQGWVICQEGARVGSISHRRGMPGADHGRWIDLRPTVFDQVRAIPGGAWVLDRGEGLAALTPRLKRYAGRCYRSADFLLDSGSHLIGLREDTWWTLDPRWAARCPYEGDVRPRNAEARATGAAVSGSRIAWWDNSFVSLAQLGSQAPAERSSAGNIDWPLIEDVVLIGPRLLVLRRRTRATPIELATYDVTRVEAPTGLGQSPPLFAAGVGIVEAIGRDDLLVVLDDRSRLSTWETSDPRRPRLLAHVDMPAPAVGMALDGRCLWLASAGSFAHLTLVELSEQGTLRELARGRIDPNTAHVSAAGGRAWTLADGQLSVYAVDDGAAGARGEQAGPDCAVAGSVTWRRFDALLPRADRLGIAMR